MNFKLIIYDNNGNIIKTVNDYVNFCNIIENDVTNFLENRNSYISIREFNIWFRNKYKCDLRFLKNAFVKNFPTFKFESHPYLIHKIRPFIFFKYKSYLDEMMNKFKTNEIYDRLIEIDPLLKGLNDKTVKTVLFEIKHMYYR